MSDESVRITLDKIWPTAGGDDKPDRDWLAVTEDDLLLDALGGARFSVPAFGGSVLTDALLSWRADVDSGPAGGDSNEWTEAAR